VQLPQPWASTSRKWEAGSAILDGGRAQFDPTCRAIRHEDAGSTFYKAFLVGHELGHAHSR
jgi:hypothetical protein